MAEFERNLKILMPDLHGGTDLLSLGQALGTRKSERQKKPSSWFNEEAGYLAEPPKSTKKKKGWG